MNTYGNVKSKAEEVGGDDKFSGRAVVTRTNQKGYPFIGGITYVFFR